MSIQSNREYFDCLCIDWITLTELDSIDYDHMYYRNAGISKIVLSEVRGDIYCSFVQIY